MRKKHSAGEAMSRFSQKITEWAGSSIAVVLAGAVIIVWGITGPLFHYSDTWQLVINTGTTIVTFLMVFLIQRSQNKDSLAIHLKLNEVVAALEGASNRLVDVESLTEEELHVLRKHFRRLAHAATRDDVITRSHSVEEAENRQAWKRHRPTPLHSEIRSAGEAPSLDD